MPSKLVRYSGVATTDERNDKKVTTIIIPIPQLFKDMLGDHSKVVDFTPGGVRIQIIEEAE